MSEHTQPIVEDWKKEFFDRFTIRGDAGFRHMAKSKYANPGTIMAFISQLLQDQKEKYREDVEALDYYWQREHQDRTLVSLQDVLNILR